MIKRAVLIASITSLSACASHNINIEQDELATARTAVAASKAAGAETCAPKLQAEAVASLYWAAHEYPEGGHIEENQDLRAAAIAKANAAKAACQAKPKVVKKAPVVAPKAIEIIKLNGIHFPHDSAELVPASITTLNKAVATLKRRADIHVEVAAHTDSGGSERYNLNLSQRRAASVMHYLISHGISADRLTSKGYGESQPVATNATREGRATNRRVELRVK